MLPKSEKVTSSDTKTSFKGTLIRKGTWVGSPNTERSRPCSAFALQILFQANYQGAKDVEGVCVHNALYDGILPRKGFAAPVCHPQRFLGQRVSGLEWGGDDD